MHFCIFSEIGCSSGIAAGTVILCITVIKKVLKTLHLFLARGLHFGDAQPDEDELLRVERIPFDEMVRRILTGKIMDGKTVAAVLKAKLLLNL